jgi:hypothetical protein
MRRAVISLPVYVVAMTGVDAVLHSAGFDTEPDMPWWLIVTFIVTALVVFCTAAWYLARQASGKIPVQRERGYAGFFVALIVAGVVDDGLKDAATLPLYHRSIWIDVPLSIISWSVLLAVLAFVTNKFARSQSAGHRADPVDACPASSMNRRWCRL